MSGASGIQLVSAATIAPVSSKWQSLRAIAARITASCHSKGIESVRDHARGLDPGDDLTALALTRSPAETAA